MTRAFLLSALLSLFASGCIYMESSHAVIGTLQQAVDPAEVRVFMEADAVPLGFREIAIIRVMGNHHATAPDLVERLREEVARLGADALVLVHFDYGSGMTATGVAVRYRPPEAAPAVTPRRRTPPGHLLHRR